MYTFRAISINRAGETVQAISAVGDSSMRTPAMEFETSVLGETRSATAAQTRFQRIHKVLRDRICLLDYMPGFQLGEEELAKEFGTSRTPIRRVLGRLESEGLIERRQGVGTIVTDVDPRALDQVYRLRLELASLMGRLAPMDCSEAHLALLQTYLARCGRLRQQRKPTEIARLTMDFCAALFSMIGNAPLREVTIRLYFQSSRFWLKSVPALDIEDEITHVERQIFDVIEALKVGDHAAVGDICRAHISMSYVRMTQDGQAGGDSPETKATA